MDGAGWRWIGARASARALVEISGVIDKPHKRAIAKILMNFVAFHLGRDEARGPRWNFLRRYVRNGESEIKARLSVLELSLQSRRQSLTTID
jgi:hypothetical protein